MRVDRPSSPWLFRACDEMANITASGRIVVIALLMTLAGTALGPHLGHAAAAQREPGAGACDDRTMRGVYAVHWTGTMLGLPTAVAGHVAFKRKHRTSGVLTEVWNGQPSRYTFDSTYSLAADCRGELTFRAEHPLLPDHRIFEFYASAGGRRASFNLTGAVEGAPDDGDEGFLSNATIILSGVGERLSRTRMRCDEEGARGVYMARFAGTTTLGPLTAVGRGKLDGEGGVSLKFSTVAPVAASRDDFYTGTYSMDPECRGEIRVSGLEGPHFELLGDHHVIDFYMAARGRRAFLITTKSWVEEVAGVGVDPLGINEDLAQGNEHEFNLTFSGVVERK